MDDELITFAEYARRQGVSRQVVSDWVRKKQLPVVRVNRVVCRVRADVLRPRVHIGRPRKELRDDEI